MDDCKHEQFEHEVKVCRLVESEEPGAKVTGYTAEIKIRCIKCKTPFVFLGVPAGLSYNRPMIDMDGTELRAPIEPTSDLGLQAQAIIDSGLIGS